MSSNDQTENSTVGKASPSNQMNHGQFSQQSPVQPSAPYRPPPLQVPPLPVQGYPQQLGQVPVQGVPQLPGQQGIQVPPQFGSPLQPGIPPQVSQPVSAKSHRALRWGVPMAAILMISLVAGLGVGFGWFSGGGYSGPPVDYSQKPMEYSLEYPSKVVYSLDFTEPIEVIALEAFTGEVTEQGEREAQFLRFTGDDFETLATVSDHVPVAVSNTVGLVMDSDTKELKLIEFSSGDITPLGFDGEKDDYYLSNDVFLRHHGNTLTAYDLNKKKMWSKRVGDSIYGAYLLSGDAIVVNSEGFDILLDKSGGKEIMKINETGKWIDAIEDGYIIGTEREHDYFTMDGEKIGTVRGPWISSLDWRDYGIKDLYRQHKEGVTQLPSQTKRSSRAGTCMGTVINIDSKAHIGDKTFDKIGDSYQWYECSPDQRTAYILDTDFDNESLTYYGFSQDSQAEPTISKQYKGVKVLPRTIYDYFRTVGVLEDESLIESDDSDYSTPTDVVDTLIIFGASNK